MTDEQKLLDAAIEKLERHQSERGARPWKVEGGAKNHDGGRVVIADAHEEEVDEIALHVFDGEDAKLMVTMCHSGVLEAILDILRDAAKEATFHSNGFRRGLLDEPNAFDQALVLAKSIMQTGPYPEE